MTRTTTTMMRDTTGWSNRAHAVDHPHMPVSMGKEGKSLSVSWREQSEPLSLPSVIIYRYFFYRQWASCVQFLCACAKEPRYFPDRGIGRSTDCELTRAARPTPGKIARGATQLRGFDPGPAAGPGEGAESRPRRCASALAYIAHSTQAQMLAQAQGLDIYEHPSTQ